MRMSNTFLNLANRLISYVVIVSLCITGGYAAYALWDNGLVYAAVDHVNEEMLELKPEAEEGAATFDELLAINSDVVGWITIDNTNMDYPILQGETNLSYINTDVYGDFSLAGSIFLDSRNDSALEDPYSLLYGHSMTEGRMFGDVTLYKEKEFFEENQTGSLLTLEESYDLTIFASLLVPANEAEIFNPTLWQDDIEKLIEYAADNALHLDQETIDRMRSMGDDVQILALTTCSYEFTDARTVILTVMEQSSAE